MSTLCRDTPYISYCKTATKVSMSINNHTAETQEERYKMALRTEYFQIITKHETQGI